MLHYCCADYGGITTIMSELSLGQPRVHLEALWIWLCHTLETCQLLIEAIPESPKTFSC